MEYKGKTLFTANIHDENLIPKLQEARVDFQGTNREEHTGFNLIFYCIILLGGIFLIWKNIFLKKENQYLLGQIKDLLENRDK